MKTTPIQLDLAAGDTHPELEYQMTDEAVPPVPVPIGSASISATLYYFYAEDEPGSPALWKQTLAKADGANGIFKFTPTSTEKYYPDVAIALGGGIRSFKGWIRYIDTDTDTDKWIKDALRVTAELPPADPL